MSESGHDYPMAQPLGDNLNDRRNESPSPGAGAPGAGAGADDPLADRPVDPLGGDPLGDRGADPLADRGADPLGEPANADVRGVDPLTGAAEDDDDTIKVRKIRDMPAAESVGAMVVSERFVSWASTHVGTVRKHNEDSLVDRSDLSLWAVADGAGGHSRGDVASRTVKESLETLSPDLSPGEVLAEVRQRMADVNATLRASVDPPEICATTVVILIARGEYYACLWAGDSRAYLLRDGEMHQISRDHSLVQEMVEAGAIRAEDAESHPNANVITRAVGSGDELELDKVTDRLVPGDRFLLCSDGLCKTIPDSLTAQLLASDDPAEKLIQAALEHRGRDNVTAVVVDVLS